MSKWRCAHTGSDRQLYDRILAEFNRIFQSANMPEGVALFESTDSFGQTIAICLTPMAVPYSQALLDMSQPWLEADGPAGGASVTWLAGDEKAMLRDGNMA